MAANELQELVDFLKSPRQEVGVCSIRIQCASKRKVLHSRKYQQPPCTEQVQKAAVDVVKGLTGSVDGLEQLMTQSKELFPALLRLVAGENDTAEAALNSLINLSQVTFWGPTPAQSLSIAHSSFLR